MVERDHVDVRVIYSKMAELLEAEGRKDEALAVLKRAVGLKEHAPARN